MKKIKNKCRLSCIALSALLISFSALSASSPSSGWGKVNLGGEILDSACSMDTESHDQAIDMGTIAISELRSLKRSEPVSFSIQLSDCVWTVDPTTSIFTGFDIVFDGPANGRYFTLSGDAKGVQLELNTEDDIQITPGEPYKENEIEPNGLIDFKLYLIPNNDGLSAGSFHTLLRFQLTYN